MLKRIALGLLVGGMITSVPWLVNKLDIEALSLVNSLDMPGAIVAIVFSGGNIHTYSLPVLLSANVLCYALAVFFWFRPKKKPSPN
jgi:hypothetical protein